MPWLGWVDDNCESAVHLHATHSVGFVIPGRSFLRLLKYYAPIDGSLSSNTSKASRVFTVWCKYVSMRWSVRK